MRVFVPPDEPQLTDYRGTLFLAGAIDNGEAEPWQSRLIADLADSDLTILNPRRADWNADLPPTVDCPEFVSQVAWETKWLTLAESVIFYFPAGSRAPITLLELGEFGTPAKAIVYVEPGYHRSGNVILACRRRGLSHFTDRAVMMERLRGSLGLRTGAPRARAGATVPSEPGADTSGRSNSLQG